MAPNPPTTHNTSAVIQKGAILFCICSIVTSAADPPPNLLKLLLQRETETASVRANYAYQQRVRIEELDPNGRKRGEYRESREVIFTPAGERVERMTGKPFQSLDRLRLTEEDFRDIRNVQPLLFTSDQLFLYQTRFKGEETIDGLPCWVLHVEPRQILEGQRLFEGFIWVTQTDYAVIQMEGRAVPQMLGKNENLFPRFRTVRKQIDGKHWFPHRTIGDEVLHFRSGDIRQRMDIEYSAYKKFAAESTIQFHKDPAKQ
jgi:hypothetical protein